MGNAPETEPREGKGDRAHGHGGGLRQHQQRDHNRDALGSSSVACCIRPTHGQPSGRPRRPWGLGTVGHRLVDGAVPDLGCGPDVCPEYVLSRCRPLGLDTIDRVDTDTPLAFWCRPRQAAQASDAAHPTGWRQRDGAVDHRVVCGQRPIASRRWSWPATNRNASSEAPEVPVDRRAGGGEWLVARCG